MISKSDCHYIPFQIKIQIFKMSKNNCTLTGNCPSDAQRCSPVRCLAGVHTHTATENTARRNSGHTPGTGCIRTRPRPPPAPGTSDTGRAALPEGRASPSGPAPTCSPPNKAALLDAHPQLPATRPAAGSSHRPLCRPRLWQPPPASPRVAVGASGTPRHG